MKKILVLVMSCNNPFFIDEEKVCRETWGKAILDGLFPNIEYWSYTSDEGNPHINFETHEIFCDSKDDIWHTYQKTYDCFKQIKANGFDFDVIFRTNTSQYVNVHLLNEFIQDVQCENNIWATERYINDTPCPLPYMVYGRGNGIILHKNFVDIILDLGKYITLSEKNNFLADDNVIGNILNSYMLMTYHGNIDDFVRSYPVGWYKSLNPDNATEEQLNIAADRFNNTECAWTNTNLDFDFINAFITIQVKSYTESDRIKEFAKMREIHKVFVENSDANMRYDTVDCIYNIYDFAEKRIDYNSNTTEYFPHSLNTYKPVYR